MRPYKRYLFLITFKSGNHYIQVLTMPQILCLTGVTIVGMTLLQEMEA